MSRSGRQGPAYTARHVIGRRLSQETRFKCVSMTMTWRATVLADTARHVIGSRCSQETRYCCVLNVIGWHLNREARVQHVLDDVARSDCGAHLLGCGGGRLVVLRLNLWPRTHSLLATSPHIFVRLVKKRTRFTQQTRVPGALRFTLVLANVA